MGGVLLLLGNTPIMDQSSLIPTWISTKNTLRFAVAGAQTSHISIVGYKSYLNQVLPHRGRKCALLSSTWTMPMRHSRRSQTEKFSRHSLNRRPFSNLQVIADF